MQADAVRLVEPLMGMLALGLSPEGLRDQHGR